MISLGLSVPAVDCIGENGTCFEVGDGGANGSRIEDGFVGGCSDGAAAAMARQ